MARRASKTARSIAEKPAAPGFFGLPFAAVLGVLALLGVASPLLLRASQAATLDYATVIAGVTGAVAAAGMLASGGLLGGTAARGVAAGGRPVTPGAPGIAKSRLAWAWAAFLAWALVSLALSGRPWAAFVGEASNMLGWAMLAVLTAVTLAAIHNAKHVRRVLEGWGWYALLGESAVVFVQLTMHVTPGGTLPNSTYLGEALLVLLPWALPSDTTPSWQRWPRLVAVVAALGALAASGARVALVAGISWAVWAIARNKAWTVRARAIGSLTLVAFVIAAGLLFARAEIVGSTSITALGTRPAMARISLAAAALRPILGWGPDGYIAGGSAASTSQLAETGPMTVVIRGSGDPHDLLLWVVVSTGVVGLALAVWFAAETVLRWRRLAKDGADVWPGVWAVAGVLAVLLTAPAFPAALPLLALALGVSLAGGDAGAATPRAQSAAAATPERAWQVAVAAALAALAVASVALALDAGTRAAIEDDAPAQSGFAAQALGAAQLWRVDPHLWLLASKYTGQAIAQDASSFPSKADLSAAQNAAVLDVRNAEYPLEVAWQLQSYRSAPAEIEQVYAEVFKRYPLHPLARAEFAIYLAGLGRTSEAQQQLTLARVLVDKDPVNTAPLQSELSRAQSAIATGAK